MSKRLQVWFEAGANVSGTDQFNLIRLKDASGNIAYKKAEDKKSADIIVFGEGVVPSDFNSQRQKAVYPLWVSHCIAETEAIPVTKRYDASLQAPQQAAPKPAPPPVTHSHLIDSDSESSSSSVKKVKNNATGDKKKKNLTKENVTKAAVKVEKKPQPASGENGMDVDHNASRRAVSEEELANEGAGSEDESLGSVEEAAPERPAKASKPKPPSTNTPRSAPKATPIKKATPYAKPTATPTSKQVPNATPLKVTPARPSAPKSGEGEKSASKKRPAEHDSSDSEEEARLAPKKKRKVAENEDTPKRVATQPKKASSDGEDAAKRRIRKSATDVEASKPVQKREKKVTRDPNGEPDVKVYICNCKQDLKESWYKRLKKSKEMMFVDHADKATHIIVANLTSKVTPDISISVIAGVASGKWMLDSSWLEEIEANRGALPENTEDFELHEFIPGCRPSRLAHELRADYLEKKGITEDEVDDDDPELPPLLFDGWTFNLDHLTTRFFHYIQNAILDCGAYLGNKLHADVWLVSGGVEVVEVIYHERQGAPEADEALKLDHPDWRKRKFPNIHTKNSMPVWAVSSSFFTESILDWEIRDLDSYVNLHTVVHALGAIKAKI